MNFPMPILTITPALSESIVDSEDDENTPLVFRSPSVPDVNIK